MKPVHLHNRKSIQVHRSTARNRVTDDVRCHLTIGVGQATAVARSSVGASIDNFATATTLSTPMQFTSQSYFSRRQLLHVPITASSAWQALRLLPFRTR